MDCLFRYAVKVLLWGKHNAQLARYRVIYVIVSFLDCTYWKESLLRGEKFI